MKTLVSMQIQTNLMFNEMLKIMQFVFVFSEVKIMTTYLAEAWWVIIYEIF